jgi:hypothetical protein
VPPEEWHTWLLSHTSLTPPICKGLVTGRLLDAHIADDDLCELARALEFSADADADALRFSDLCREGCNVLLQNLEHLFGSLSRGGKKAVAAQLSIDPTTVSRWLGGTCEPHASSLRQLTSYFGLPADTDLRDTPIFLSADPVTVTERRRWLHAQVDAMNPEDLRDLYPALRRLLEEP